MATRWLARLGFALFALAMIWSLVDSAGSFARPHRFAVGILALAAGGTSLAFHLARLARRIPDVRLVRRCHVTGLLWGVIILLVVVLAYWRLLPTLSGARVAVAFVGVAGAPVVLFVFFRMIHTMRRAIDRVIGTCVSRSALFSQPSSGRVDPP